MCTNFNQGMCDSPRNRIPEIKHLASPNYHQLVLCYCSGDGVKACHIHAAAFSVTVVGMGLKLATYMQLHSLLL